MAATSPTGCELSRSVAPEGGSLPDIWRTFLGERPFVRFEQVARGLLGIRLLLKHAQYAIVGFAGFGPFRPALNALRQDRNAPGCFPIASATSSSIFSFVLGRSDLG